MRLFYFASIALLRINLGFRISRAGFTWDAGNIAVVGSDVKKSGLFGSVPSQLFQVQFARFVRITERLFSLALDAAFGFVPLFLLARVFFLAFGET